MWDSCSQVAAAVDLYNEATWDPSVEGHMEGAGLHPRGEQATLENAVQGCLHAAIERLELAAQGVGAALTVAVPAALAEVEFWRSTREQLERDEVAA